MQDANHLPANKRLKRPYNKKAVMRGRCWVQRGLGIGSNTLKLAKKVVKAPIVQELGKMALNELRNV